MASKETGVGSYDLRVSHKGLRLKMTQVTSLQSYWEVMEPLGAEACKMRQDMPVRRLMFRANADYTSDCL